MLLRREYLYFVLNTLLALLFKTIVQSSHYVSSQCETGFFLVANMTSCHPWLTCREIRSMEIGPLIGYGAVKQVYQSFWGNYMVALNAINDVNYTSDFRQGLEMLKELGPSEYIVQLVGFCSDDDVFVSEYHPLGNSLEAFVILCEKPGFDLKQRFMFCFSYVETLSYIHNSPKGKRVMCDSSTLNKTLEQYLVTSSHNLILNDVDALPEVGKDGIVCGHKELSGSFVAPEQEWPYAGDDFQTEKMIPYNEKSDIYKIPAVCNYFLGDDESAKAFRYHLHPVHQKCRHKIPDHRPTADEVLFFYEELFSEYFYDDSNPYREEL